MRQGWILIWRKIQSHWIWQDRPFTLGQAWIDLILRANHKDGNKFVFNGSMIVQRRGEFITSIRELAGEWGWSRTKAERFLRQLENDRMLIVKRATHYTSIFIMNFNIYQPDKDGKVPQKSRQKAAKKHNQRMKKNDKEGKRNRERKNFQKPTVDEVKTYCEERKNSINPQRFVDFYEAKGWRIGKDPMKDWRAAVRTWEQRDGERKPERTGKYDHLITKA